MVHTIDYTLDLIYEYIDERFNDHDFGTIDDILKNINVGGVDTEVLIGYLTATLPARKNLTNRNSFYLDVKYELMRRGEYERNILHGLR